MTTLRLGTACIAVLLCVAPAAGAVFTVDDTADAVDAQPGDGVCATAAGRCTLRAAVQEANALPGADQVDVPPGTYLLTLSFSDEDLGPVYDDSRGDLDITSDLDVLGTGGRPDVTVIDGLNGGDRVFQVAPGATVTISTVTMRHGGAYADGGLSNAGTVTLDRCIVEDCLAGNPSGGSGGLGNSGTMTVRDCTIRNNAGRVGGGIGNSGTLQVTGSTISGNGAVDGGGVANGGTMTITNSTIDGNTAGGRYLDVETPFPGFGGGIFNDGSVSLINSTVTANVASSPADDFGGPYSGFGGGLSRLSTGTFELTNTIVASNEPADCYGSATTVSHGHNLSSDATCNLGAPGDQTTLDPVAGPLQDNGGPTVTRALLSGSPAIDAGDDSACPAKDQRGAPRPQGAACDIGAYEVSGPFCGDGTVDAGEQCDDGNVWDGDCCSRACQFEPSAAPCLDDGNPCTLDRCNAAGTCLHPAGPADVPCADDADPCTRDRCDAAGACTHPVVPRNDCRIPDPKHTSFALRRSKPTLRWSWRDGMTSTTDFGTPTTTTGYTLCAYDESAATQPLLRVAVPPGGTCGTRPCWKATSHGFAYKDHAGSAAGILGVTLTGGQHSKVSVKGGGPNLAVPILPLTPAVTVQLTNDESGVCWGASYPTATKNDGDRFQAK